MGIEPVRPGFLLQRFHAGRESIVAPRQFVQFTSRMRAGTKLVELRPKFGKPLGEFAFFSFSFAHVGYPVSPLSGDDRVQHPRGFFVNANPRGQKVGGVDVIRLIGDAHGLAQLCRHRLVV